MIKSSSSIARTALLAGFVITSPMAMAGKPSCSEVCSASAFMDWVEVFELFDSLQSCSVVNEQGRRAARADYLRPNGDLRHLEFAIAGHQNFNICITINEATGFFEYVDISKADYVVCADEFIAECTARLNN